MLFLDAVLVAKELNGTPVRLVWSREDELSWSPLAPGMVTKIDANLADNLMIESFDISIKSPPHCLLYTSPSPRDNR